MSEIKKRLIINLLILIAGLILVLAGMFYWQKLQDNGSVILPPSEYPLGSGSPKPSENKTDFPLQLPAGFSISVFAKDIPGARVMEFDSFGNMWVSQTSKGTISLLYVQEGKVTQHGVILKDLDNPHGLVFDPEFETLLYFAEENKVSTLPTYSDGGPMKIMDLPSGGGHFTRTINIGPDNRLYVSIGSSCNVCHESNSMRAKIYSSNRDGSDLKEFARGLRNAVFFDWHPKIGKMWATEMGRDLLGDDVPPDEINIIEEGNNYGWPNCYGNNIHDTSFDKNTYIRNPCSEPFEIPARVDLQAHSAPLGLAFVPDSWPVDFKDDIIVAFHGSWNRSKATGYKLVRIKLDDQGNYQGTEDFITGWLSSGEVLGRPVDTKFGPDGNLYVSDDKAGIIYKIEYKN